MILEKHSRILILAMQIPSLYWNVCTQPCRCLCHSTNFNTRAFYKCVCLFIPVYLILYTYIIYYNIFYVYLYMKELI